MNRTVYVKTLTLIEKKKEKKLREILRVMMNIFIFRLRRRKNKKETRPEVSFISEASNRT